MQQTFQPKFAPINDRIFCGQVPIDPNDAADYEDMKQTDIPVVLNQTEMWGLIAAHQISAIINYSGYSIKTPQSSNIRVFNCALPIKELLETEYKRVIEKLKTSSNDIIQLLANGHKVLLLCDDGRNRSLLAVGHYLLYTTLGSAKGLEAAQQKNALIDKLEMIYFNAKQREADIVEKTRFANYEEPPQYSTEEFKAVQACQAARRELRGLTLMSFKNLLRTVEGQTV
jgi:hypothetical protein